MMIGIILCLYLCLSLILSPKVASSFCVENSIMRWHHRFLSQHYSTPKQSPLNDEPWEKDDSYWDMLQAASKDPETFEKFIEESMKKRSKTGNVNEIEGKRSVVASSLAINGDASDNNNFDIEKKKKYVPIEEWEEQRKEGENMSWEERLQWESQRGGNQFRQNEILRQNLKQF